VLISATAGVSRKTISVRQYHMGSVPRVLTGMRWRCRFSLRACCRITRKNFDARNRVAIRGHCHYLKTARKPNLFDDHPLGTPTEALQQLPAGLVYIELSLSAVSPGCIGRRSSRVERSGEIPAICLAQVGLPCADITARRGALLPHLFTLPQAACGFAEANPQLGR